MVPSLDILMTTLEGHGYQTRKSMYGAPYDWRLNPVSIESVYKQAKDLVEEVYKNHSGKKVALYGYSAGCYAMHRFLTKGVDQPWKDKYIDRAVFVAPSYGGGASAMSAIWTKAMWLPGSNTTAVKNMMMSLPTLYGHLPRWDVYKDKPVIVGPNGTTVRANELREFFYGLGKVPDCFKDIYDYVDREVLSQPIEDPGVDSMFLINAALNSIQYLQFNNSWDDDPTAFFEKGDLVLNRDTLYWGCEHWKSGHSVVCHDYNSLNMSWGHGAIMSVPEAREDMYKAITQDGWKIGGNGVFVGPSYDGWEKDIERI
jgi:hypothetical protein